MHRHTIMNVKSLTATLALLIVAGACPTGLRAQMSAGGQGYYSGGNAGREAKQVSAVNLAKPQKLKFYFVMGSSELVLQYGPNLMQMQQFDSLAKRVAALNVSRIDSVVMTAYTSPTDSKIGSRELAGSRLTAVKDYIIRTLEHNDLQGVNILSHVRSADGDGDEELEGSDDPWLTDDVYDRVRRVEFTAYLNAAQVHSPAMQMQSQFSVTPELTEMMSDTMSAAQRDRQRAAVVTNPYPVWNPVGSRTHNKRVGYNGPVNQLFALRTNIPYWLVLAPNAGVEFYIGSRFSVLLEGTLSYWEKKNDTGNKGIYIAGGGPEFRYWLSDDRSESSHLFGIYGQWAEFDIKLNDKGRQGTAIGGGISYGYYMPVGRRWAFEFGIGIGYLQNKFDVYKWNPVLQKNLWVEQKTKAWIGPTKVKAAVIFRIGNKNR